MPEAARRELKFEQLGDVVADAESLQSSGYTKVGKWDLTQVCGHLAEWMRFPVEGFPRPGILMRPMMWAMRNTVGGRTLRNIIDSGSMSAGIPTIPRTVPEPGEDATEAIAKLREAVAQFEAHTGDVHPSPVFGKMDRGQAWQLQLVHCAHHLSFLIPVTSPETDTPG